MAGFVVRKITVFSIFSNQQTIALVTLNNVLECYHFFIYVRCIHIFFYFRIDVQSSVQFSEYAKSSNLGGVPHPPPPPIPSLPTALTASINSTETALLKVINDILVKIMESFDLRLLNSISTFKKQ